MRNAILPKLLHQSLRPQYLRLLLNHSLAPLALLETIRGKPNASRAAYYMQ